MSKSPWTSEGKNLGGRSYLIAKLEERGLSRRRSLRVLNFLFKEMKQALARGEEVEFAGGKLQRVERYFSKSWNFVDDYPAKTGSRTRWSGCRAGKG